MSWRDAPLYIEAHDLVRWVLERTTGWPDGSPIAGRLSDAGCELVESVALALTFPQQRAAHLRRADAAIVRIRMLLRLARDLGLLPAGGVRYAAGRLRAIGRMVGGWRRRVECSQRPTVQDVRNQGAGHPASGA